MASSSITAYKDTENTVTFALVSTSALETSWRVSGRALSEPYELKVTRKIGNPGSKANDVVHVRISRTEHSAVTGLPASGNVHLSVSIPRDAETLTSDMMLELMGILSSLLNEGEIALAATHVNRSALVEGRDF